MFVNYPYNKIKKKQKSLNRFKLIKNDILILIYINKKDKYMKSTIEVKGYKIVIEEGEETISVIATKDDETIEEFEINVSEEGEDSNKEEKDGDEKNVKSFDDFEEEDDFEEKGETENDDDDEDIDFDSENDDEEDEYPEDVEDKNPDKEVQALESFNSFLRRSKKR